MMAAIAKKRDDDSGLLATGGSSTAYTLTTNQGMSPLVDGYSVTAKISVTNGAAPQLNVDSTGLKDIRTNTSAAVPEGAMLAKAVHRFTYSSGDNCWYVAGFFAVTTLAGGSLNIIGTTELTAPAIDDVALIYDLSATANRRITLLNLLKVVAALTAETAVAVDDSLLLYDLSETAVNKITPVSLLNVLSVLTEDTSPDLYADFALSYDTSASTVKKTKLANLLTPGTLLAILEETTSSGVNGASVTSGGDRTRVLNTSTFIRGSLVSLASNQFTLAQAGSYEIEWYSPVGININGTFHQSMLYDVTAGAVIARGTSAIFNNPDVSGDAASKGLFRVTIAAANTYEIRHNTSATGAVLASARGGTEHFTRVAIRVS